MRIDRADPDAGKGWFARPWNSDLNVPVGFRHEVIGEPHAHGEVTEIYLVAHGSSVMRVEQETIKLHPGDLAAIEPGEAHTFLSSSSHYLHFVARVPALTAAEARPDKVSVTHSRLGL